MLNHGKTPKKYQLLYLVCAMALTAIIATIIDSSVFELSLYYFLFVVSTKSWVEHVNTPQMKSAVFGICTFISAMVSIAVIDFNPLAILLMSVLWQLFSLSITEEF